ncbi:hypothetical protein CCGE525_37370 (plasmid) [Rhizobium jaguaris]|uniref:Uncharacterized protein n=1 Tax=Rhizobium jaguaris TaxID=1312183 RepID=A0A387G9B4_9HYPH|nr:hypothetical protein CCGE525_37370 [Rhizobium jaguaris]
MTETETANRVQEILTGIKPLTAEYYPPTDKSLGVTGELAVAVRAEILGLDLASDGTETVDAESEPTRPRTAVTLTALFPVRQLCLTKRSMARILRVEAMMRPMAKSATLDDLPPGLCVTVSLWRKPVER